MDVQEKIALRIEGDNFVTSEKFEEAICTYTKAIELDPTYIEAYNRRGEAYSKLMKNEDAINDYTKVIELDPSNKEAYCSRAKETGKLGNYVDTISDCTKALEIDSNYTDAYRVRGVAYFYQDKYEEAMADLTRAIEIDPSFKSAYIVRGLTFFKQEKYEKAIVDYTRVIEIDPSLKEAYNGRGNVYKNQRKYVKAIDDYTKALEIDSNYAFVYNNRALVYKDLGEYEKAIDDFSKAIEINPTYKQAYNNRATVYEEQKKYDEAIGDYTKALEIDPNYELAYNNRERVKKLIDNDYVPDEITIQIQIRDEKFYKYIEKTESDVHKKKQIFELFLTVMELKDKLLYTDSRFVGHYTKTSNLKHLIKPIQRLEKEEKEARLRLNNVSYMNDPTEGEVLIRLLKQYSEEDSKELVENLYRNKSDNNREVLNGKNHVFLVSFSSAIDTSLPMWVQYSDNGEGCCLVFNSAFFDKEDKNCLSYVSESDASEGLLDIDSEINDACKSREKPKTYYCLYKIEYIRNENDRYKIENEEIAELLIRISDKVKDFREDIEGNGNPSIKGIIQNILDQVRFLFKDQNYEHEEEVRLVKFEDNGNVKYTGSAEGFRVPHVYIELERDLKLEEIILGPKVQNPIEIANYLYYTDRVKEVSKSKIRYK